MVHLHARPPPSVHPLQPTRAARDHPLSALPPLPRPRGGLKSKTGARAVICHVIIRRVRQPVRETKIRCAYSWRLRL